LNLIANAAVSFNWLSSQQYVNVTGESLSAVNSSIISDVLVNLTGTPQTVVYNVIGSSTFNGCSTPVFPIWVTVNPAPTMAAVSNITVCNGAATPVVQFNSNSANTVYNWTNANPSIGLSSFGSGNIASFNGINLGFTPVTSIVTVNPTLTTNGLTCTGNTQTFTYTINPTPKVNPVASQTICNNTATNQVILSGPVAGTVFSWTNANPSIGLANTGTGNIPSFIGQNNTFAPILSNVTITPTYTNNNVTCTGQNFVTNFTILPTPNVYPVSNQIICDGSATNAVVLSGDVLNTQFSWTNSNNTIGLSSSGSGNIPAFTAQNNNNLPALAQITITPSIQSGTLTCSGNPINYNYQINPTPTVNPMLNLAYCNNTLSVVDFNSTFMGNNPDVTYNWTNSNTTIGIPSNGSGDINFLATNTGNAPVTSQIIVTPTYTNNGVSCSGIPVAVFVTVNPSPTVDFVPNQTVCANTGVVVDFNSSFNVVNSNYTWTNNNTLTGLPSSGTGDISFTSINTTNTAQNSIITVTPTFTNAGGTCNGIPQSFIISVNPVPVISAVPNQTVCANSSSTPINFNSTVIGTAYSWTNTNSTIGIGSSGLGNIPGFVGLNNGQTPNQGSFQVNASYTNNGLTCPGNSQLFNITINPAPTVSPLPNITLCANSVSNQISFTGNIPGTTYTWQNSNTTIGLAASGTGTIPPFTAVNTSGNITTATITVTPFFVNNGDTCIGNTQTFTISVNPTPTVNALPNLFYCNNFSTNNVVFTGSISGTVFNWTSSNPSIGMAASGNGTITSFVTNNTQLTPQTSNITVIPAITLNGLTCWGNPQNFNITVNPTPTVADPVDQIVCSGTPTSNVIFNGTVPNTIYIWQNNNTLTGLASNGTGNIFSFVTPNNLNNPAVSTVTVTPTFVNSVTCEGQSQIFTITVNPTPNMTAPANQVRCNGDQINSIVFTSNVNNATYNWVNSNTAIGLGSSGTGNIPAFTAINNGNTPIASTIIVTPFFVNNGDTCIGNTQTFTITVNPTPVFTVPSDKVICNGDIASGQILSSPVNGITYTWTNNNTLIGLAAGGSGNVPSFTATNTTNNPISGLITITASYTNGGQTCTLTGSYTITVNPTPNVVDPLDQVKCHSDLSNIVNFQGGVTGTVFDWLNSNVGIGLNSNGTGNIAPFTVNNTSFVPISGIITVTPSYTNLGLTCVGSPQSFTITVNPIPNVVDPIDQIVCNSTPTAAVNFQGNVPNTVYNWQNSTTSIGLAANGIGNIASFTAINNTTNPVIGYLAVTPVFTNLGLSCTGQSQDFTITVNPSAILTNQASEICSNTILGINLTSSIPATFTWQAISNPNVTGETFLSAQTSATITDVLVNTTNAPQTVVYEIFTTSSAYGCQAGPFLLSVVVNPLPDVQFSTLNNPNCNLTPIVFVNNTPGNNLYFWDFGDNSTSTDEDPTHIYTDYGTYTVNLQAIDIATGCSNTASNIISIFESPTVGFEVSSTVGCEFLNVIFTDTINDPNTTVEWDFGDGETSNQPGAIDHQFVDEGCYDVSLTVTNLIGCSITLTQEDIVCVVSAPDANFFANPDSALVTEPIISFNNQSLNAYTYVWDFGDGTTSLSTNPIHEFDDVPNDYVVTLYAYNEEGCYDSVFLTVTIYEDLIFYVPNSFTPNGDGTNDIFLPIITSGVDLKGYELSIFNRWGEEVFKTNDITQGWDGFVPDLGTLIGINPDNKAQDGTYVWKITLNALQNEGATVYTGHVNLLR
jgi:gliding motility-associated-like protein